MELAISRCRSTAAILFSFVALLVADIAAVREGLVGRSVEYSNRYKRKHQQEGYSQCAYGNNSPLCKHRWPLSYKRRRFTEDASLFGFVVREVATLHERIVAPKHVGRNIVNPICSSPGQERWWRQFAAGVRNIDAPDDCSLPQSARSAPRPTCTISFAIFPTRACGASIREIVLRRKGIVEITMFRVDAPSSARNLY